MQEISLARHKGARVCYDSETERLLEDSSDIVVENQSRRIASLFGLKLEAGALSFKQKPGLLHYGNDKGDDDWVSMYIYSCDRLTWSHAGAMCVLQGMPLAAVLGPSWVVIDGRPTLPGDPLPGLMMPILAQVFDNPTQRPHTEIFKVVREILGL